ncbi:MAG: efflux RND transporter permease subunit, partial [Phycisphaerae bacterium]
LVSIGLVILVVFIFLRDVRSTLIPSVAVPVSLIGTLGVMYLLGYSIDNLSLMALTIATGFVVDDAIVVIENITRYLEQGLSPMAAALRGAKEIGFTVISMSLSLIAVFIPILLMGGLVGRLFREFAVTLSVAILISLVISLTTTPMMCAWLLRHRRPEEHGRIYRFSERIFEWVLDFYRVTLGFVLRHSIITMVVLAVTVALNIYLYRVIPNDLFPQQDTGRLDGSITADQDVSSLQMRQYLTKYAALVSSEPIVERVVGFAGSGNTARMFVILKPLAERKISADQAKEVLRAKVARVSGASCIFNPQQDLRIGGRSSRAQYQYTLQGDNLQELAAWAPKVVNEMKNLPGVVDVSSDQQDRGLQANLIYDRTTAARLGLTPALIDSTLYDAFGQRQVSTMYKQLNQYHVVMEVDPGFSQDPGGFKYTYVHAAGGNPVPLSAFTTYVADSTPLSVNHQSQFPAITISFNLRPGMSLGTAVTEIEDAGQKIGLPQAIHGKFAGTAQAFQDARANQPYLIAAALAAVYIVLGMLYESYIHPITILSTLPSAGVGALLALMLFKTPLTVIALIGIILLIGIVKKNAIMMIDFALDQERNHGKSPRDAIFQACIMRFRPITMTTMAALLGGLPLALGTGIGSELRRPLGIAIVGGLIFSQALTLYTTPVIYLYLDRFRLWTWRPWRRPALQPPPPVGVPEL